MIKNYFLLTFRSMMKNKLFIVINVLGLGIAIACCIVGFLAYEYDATFDAIHKNRDAIYRISAVREFEGALTRFGVAPLPLGEVVDKSISDVDQSSRYSASRSNFKLKDDLFASNLTYVDGDFFKMFSFDFIAGNPGDLNDKNSLFISETMAIRLFSGPEEALGKNITQVYRGELKELKIAGVFREPAANSSFHSREGSAYANFENFEDEFSTIEVNDWRQESTLFIQVNDANRLSAVHKQLQSFIPNNNKVREDFQVNEFALDPLITMAHRDRDENVQAATWAAPPSAAIIGSLIMGGLIVLIACFNLTNTAIAISSSRLKEIGIRKVMGSMRMQLIIQFISETTFICFLALLVGLGLADILIAGWNIMTANNIHIEPHYLDTPAFLLFLVGVLALTGILAGSYPAFYISKFKPVNILKGKLQFGGTNYFTRTLLGAQFAISLISIVSAIGLLQNARYQRDFDLGFDVRGSVVARIDNQNEFETYRNALEKNPKVLSIAGARSGIFSDPAHEPINYESKQAEVDIIEVGDGYLKTMDLKLLQGRDFIKDSETDRKESIIITQRMADLFGWNNPLGKEIIWKDTAKLYVIGVVKDVYTKGLWRAMEPMMIRYVLPEQYSQLVVTAKAQSVSDVNQFMKEQWSSVFPNRLYNGYMLTTVLQQATDLSMSIVYGYGFLGSIALLLSATGLFSLLSLNIVKRTKEIGVRKVLGASVFNITRVVNTEFIVILLIASVIGSWASYTWCSVIMSSIWKYYQGLNALTFIVAIGILLSISFLVLGSKVISMIRMNPVNTLRDE